MHSYSPPPPLPPVCRMCPIFQISNVTGENMELLKMFLNLLSCRTAYSDDEPAEFQIDDTYSVPVGYLTHARTRIHLYIHTYSVPVGQHRPTPSLHPLCVFDPFINCAQIRKWVSECQSKFVKVEFLICGGSSPWMD